MYVWVAYTGISTHMFQHTWGSITISRNISYAVNDRDYSSVLSLCVGGGQHMSMWQPGHDNELSSDLGTGQIEVEQFELLAKIYVFIFFSASELLTQNTLGM